MGLITHKLIKITSRGRFEKTNRQAIIGPQISFYSEQVSEIKHMLTKYPKVKIIEKLGNGMTVNLTLDNYNKDNDVKNGPVSMMEEAPTVPPVTSFNTPAMSPYMVSSITLPSGNVINVNSEKTIEEMAAERAQNPAPENTDDAQRQEQAPEETDSTEPPVEDTVDNVNDAGENTEESSTIAEQTTENKVEEIPQQEQTPTEVAQNKNNKQNGKRNKGNNKGQNHQVEKSTEVVPEEA